MPAGIIIRNNSNELVFSSDAYTFGYVGAATFLGTVQPGTVLPAYEGYSQYSITWAGDLIMVGLPLPTSAATATGFLAMVKSGSLWTIYVRRGDGAALNAAGFRGEAAPPAVHVWGIPHSDPGFGVLIRAADGSLRADLSRRPLAIAARVAFASGATSGAMTAVTSPLILTACLGGQFVNDNYPGIGNGIISRALWWLDGTTLRRVLVQREKYAGEDGPSQAATYSAMTALITSAAGL